MRRGISHFRVETNVTHCLELAFLATLVRSSKMCRNEGGIWPVNSYWIPRTYLVRNGPLYRPQKRRRSNGEDVDRTIEGEVGKS